MAIKIWYQDIQDFLLNPKTVIEIIPEKNMTFEQQLNAIVRFALFFSIIVFFVRRNYQVFYFFIIIAVFSIGLYYNKSYMVKEKMELFDKLNIDVLPGETQPCYKPTIDNPFMNVSIADYQDFPNRPPACNILNADVKEQIQTLFEENSMIDTDDVFHRNTGFWNFYTNPSTQIPNDQDSFAKWLYQSTPTCKERNFACRG